jgi:hypothetical protein
LGHDARQFLNARLHGVRNPLQDAPALARRHLAPARKRRRGGFHRFIDVLGPPARNAADDLAIARVLHLNRTA